MTITVPIWVVVVFGVPFLVFLLLCLMVAVAVIVDVVKNIN